MRYFWFYVRSNVGIKFDCTRGFHGQMGQLLFDKGHLQHIIYIMHFVLANLLPVE